MTQAPCLFLAFFFGFFFSRFFWRFFFFQKKPKINHSSFGSPGTGSWDLTVPSFLHPGTLQCLVLRSDFDSGNAQSVAVDQSTGTVVVRTKWDSFGTGVMNSCRSWFHFKVSGLARGESVRLCVANLNNQGKLFSQGLRPVCSVAGGPWERVASEPTWTVYVPPGPPQEGSVPTAKGKPERSLRVEWLYTHAGGTAADEVAFAFSYPHSYADCQALLAGVEARHARPGVPVESLPEIALQRPRSIYVHRERLAVSVQGRRVDMLTVSSLKHVLGRREPELPAPLFSDGAARAAAFSEAKPILFVSARVHPGETPASHVLNGFLEFVLREDDARAQALRDRFVVKLVPMLNPDGVFLGHYRADSLGANLNRFYRDPDPLAQPAVWAVRTYLLSEHVLPKLHLYLDCHAHAAKRGCFLYGNSLADFEKQVDAVLFAKVLSLNTAHFDFAASNFTEENMVSLDRRDGLSKEGSGRVGIFQATGERLPFIYTLECNYNMGRLINAVPPVAGNADRGAASPERPARGRPPFYAISHYEEVGRAIAVTVLDMAECNPWSRIPSGPHKSLEHIRTFVRSHVRAGAYDRARANKEDDDGEEDDDNNNSSSNKARPKPSRSISASSATAAKRAAAAAATTTASSSIPSRPSASASTKRTTTTTTTRPTQPPRPPIRPILPQQPNLKSKGGEKFVV